MQKESLAFQLNNFEGPLDLLLTLVKDKKMDLMSINLADLASQYLALIDKLKTDNIDLAGEYLVMAATLLQLKAKLILEVPNKEVAAEKADLLRQLVEYQQFKHASEQLRVKEKARQEIFIKATENYTPWLPQPDETRLDGKSDAIKLIIAMRKMFERRAAQKLREASIHKKFKMTSAERRLELIAIFNKHQHPTFDQLFSVPTMNHFLLTMITLLDMARKHEVVMEQSHQEAEIHFQKGVRLHD